jgi:hypothetical protein
LEDNIKMKFKYIGCEGVAWIQAPYVRGQYTKGGEFFEQLREYWLLR